VKFDNIQIEYHITDGLNIPYIDLPALIKNKRSTGRLRDLADCEELEKVMSHHKSANQALYLTPNVVTPNVVTPNVEGWLYKQSSLTQSISIDGN